MLGLGPLTQEIDDYENWKKAQDSWIPGETEFPSPPPAQPSPVHAQSESPQCIENVSNNNNRRLDDPYYTKHQNQAPNIFAGVINPLCEKMPSQAPNPFAGVTNPLCEKKPSQEPNPFVGLVDAMLLQGRLDYICF